MENIDELKREAEEAKERIKKDMTEIAEILGKIAEEAGERGKTRVLEAMERVEKRIGETLQTVEKRLEKAITIACECSVETGSVVTKKMDMTDFTNVEVGHAFKVDITRSDSYSVNITASENLFDCMDVTKSGSTLKISLKPLRFQARPTLEARITMPSLSKLRLAGATRGKVRGFSSQENFDLMLSGGSTLDIDMETGDTRFEISGASRLCGNIKAGDAEFVLSGASQAALKGSADKVVLSAWGASKLDLADFALHDTAVHLKGASQAAVNVNGRLDLDLSGCSRLKYKGNPTIHEVSVSGASTISQE
jgi:ElaB/YqjD/DUF883 family membrane-anchored ribosome-binding protein